jgi:hypothetical protein
MSINSARLSGYHPSWPLPADVSAAAEPTESNEDPKPQWPLFLKCRDFAELVEQKCREHQDALSQGKGLSSSDLLEYPIEGEAPKVLRIIKRFSPTPNTVGYLCEEQSGTQYELKVLSSDLLNNPGGSCDYFASIFVNYCLQKDKQRVYNFAPYEGLVQLWKFNGNVDVLRQSVKDLLDEAPSLHSLLMDVLRGCSKSYFLIA